MTDERVSRVFTEGTAPERDGAFARRVDVEIGRERLSWRLIALAVRMLVVATLAGAVFITLRVIEPSLTMIAEGGPLFMGVPVPLVLGALAIGLFVHALRFVRAHPAT